MSADFGSIAGAGVGMIGTLAVVGAVSNIANRTISNTNRNYPRAKTTRYSPKRTMSHRSVYKPANLKYGYSVFR